MCKQCNGLPRQTSHGPEIKETITFCKSNSTRPELFSRGPFHQPIFRSSDGRALKQANPNQTVGTRATDASAPARMARVLSIQRAHPFHHWQQAAQQNSNKPPSGKHCRNAGHDIRWVSMCHIGTTIVTARGRCAGHLHKNTTESRQQTRQTKQQQNTSRTTIALSSGALSFSALVYRSVCATKKDRWRSRASRRLASSLERCLYTTSLSTFVQNARTCLEILAARRRRCNSNACITTQGRCMLCIIATQQSTKEQTRQIALKCR